MLTALLFVLSFGSAMAQTKNEILLEKMLLPIEKKFNQIMHIRAKEVAKIDFTKEKVLLIDVRENAERNISYIPHSVSKKEFEKESLKYHDYLLIPYCTIGYRSAEYTQELIQRGFHSKNFIGSILSWTHLGLPLINAQGKTQNVHVYGKKWNLVNPPYTGIY